jgi:hypothetical protein
VRFFRANLDNNPRLAKHWLQCGVHRDICRDLGFHQQTLWFRTYHYIYTWGTTVTGESTFFRRERIVDVDIQGSLNSILKATS